MSDSAINTADVAIVRGVAEDAGELAAFAARSFSESFSDQNNTDDMREHLAKNYGQEQQSAELADASVITLMAKTGHRNGCLCAGFATASHRACVDARNPIELHRFYVDRRAHGTGLAAELMQEALAAAAELGGLYVWLGCWERNARAIAFYKKQGFVDVGETFYMVGPRPSDGSSFGRPNP